MWTIRTTFLRGKIHRGFTHCINSIDELINWTTDGEIEARVEKDEVEEKEKNIGFSG